MEGLCGIHCTTEYIVLARRDGAEQGVNSLSLQPLDTNMPYFEALEEGFSTLQNHDLLSRRERIVLAFTSHSTHVFHTELPAEVEDPHEMMSWELQYRINEPVSAYFFDVVKTGLNRALGVAVREHEVKKFAKLCKKKGLRLQAVDTDVLSIFNVYDLNYDSTVPAMLLHFDSTGITAVFFQNKTVYHVSNIPPLNKETEAKELHRVAHDVATLLRALGFSQGVPLYLSGEILTDTALQVQLLKELPEAKMLDPFRRLSATVGMDEATLDKFAPLMTVAVGLSQRNSW
ncbi:hypothetical protein [Chitinivibrio alkaliphilus]|uniref:Type IV pilus assembly protein PilM n=1 Tax=Chitinivibrio alkaliphilus ACht1 TaxID=1313304 RepID=U7DB21_9BACT|nr:hypothetical protein [Chitinivibrio alkaliphilus]ERP31605.1 hypothetical protein CALK_1468 [Chitinivibrio alkaliphilus ACht1]